MRGYDVAVLLQVRQDGCHLSAGVAPSWCGIELKPVCGEAIPADDMTRALALARSAMAHMMGLADVCSGRR